MSQPLPDHIQALAGAGGLPGYSGTVELVQTHISYVLLAGSEVYKLKKPLNLGFVDFTTLASRKEACEAEVQLNRRGCPGNVYLGVMPVNRHGDSYRLGGEGDVVDYAVHMKRLPQERMMDRLLDEGQVTLPMIGRVAARLTELQQRGRIDRDPKGFGGPENHKDDWHGCLADIDRFAGDALSRQSLDALRTYAYDTIEKEKRLLQRRKDSGWVRECHGDLRSDSVCFDESEPGGICIYDCIEFNDAFRIIDTGLDAAFLAMDLDFRGHSDLSDLFIGLYCPAIGDDELPILLNLFKAYRAAVRGRVESLLSVDPQVPLVDQADARDRANRYFRLAETYARKQSDDHLVLVTGPSGSGKSVLAGSLAARLGSSLVSTDMIRRQLFGQQKDAGEPLAGGIYTEERRERVYSEVMQRATQHMNEGRSVVIDGTFLTKERRKPIIEAARSANRPLLIVECSSPDDVIYERQEQRRTQSWNISEGRYDVYRVQKAEMYPVTEVGSNEHIDIDTTSEIESQLEQVERRLARSSS